MSPSPGRQTLPQPQEAPVSSGTCYTYSTSSMLPQLFSTVTCLPCIKLSSVVHSTHLERILLEISLWKLHNTQLAPLLVPRFCSSAWVFNITLPFMSLASLIHRMAIPIPSPHTTPSFVLNKWPCFQHHRVEISMIHM